jgi:hypothetical protein
MSIGMFTPGIRRFSADIEATLRAHIINKFKKPEFTGGIRRADLVMSVLYIVSLKDLLLVISDFERLIKELVDENIIQISKVYNNLPLHMRRTLDGFEWTYTLKDTPAAAAAVAKAAEHAEEISVVHQNPLRRGPMKKASPIAQMKVVGSHKKKKKIDAKRSLQPVLDLIAAAEDGNNGTVIRKSTRRRTATKKM